MSCCGGRRRAARTPGSPSQAPRTPPPRAPASAVPVRYTGGHPIVLRGSATGRTYLFDAGAEVPVDARDLPGLPATLFDVR